MKSFCDACFCDGFTLSTDGLDMKIVIVASREQGALATTIKLHELTQARIKDNLPPFDLAAMIGTCAGRNGTVHVGDVCVGTRVLHPTKMRFDREVDVEYKEYQIGSICRELEEEFSDSVAKSLGGDPLPKFCMFPFPVEEVATPLAALVQHLCEVKEAVSLSVYVGNWRDDWRFVRTFLTGVVNGAGRKRLDLCGRSTRCGRSWILR